MNLMKVIHNNIASFAAWKNGVLYRSQKYVEQTDNYYILSPGDYERHCINDTYTANSNTHLTYTLVPGTGTGDFWVGNMGSNDPYESDDSRDFRVGCPDGWEQSFVDLGENRGDLDYVIDGETPKITIEQYNWGCNVYDASGELIVSEEFGSVEDFESTHIFIQGIENFKLYSVKIEDDVEGVILDAYCTPAGLIDSVTGNNITPEGWTVGMDE